MSFKIKHVFTMKISALIGIHCNVFVFGEFADLTVQFKTVSNTLVSLISRRFPYVLRDFSVNYR